MKFIPKLPKHNDNVSHNDPLLEFLMLLGALIVGIILVLWLLGFAIDAAIKHISPQREVALFGRLKFMGFEGRKSPQLQALVDQLRPCIGLDQAIDVRIVDSNTVNAFALPGGKFIVMSALIDKMRSENGLSFVLAHELAHIKNRDHLRQLGRAIVVIAVSSIIFGDSKALSGLFTSAKDLSISQHSQHRELQADQMALDVLNCHYGHTSDANQLFVNGLLDKATNFTLDTFHLFSSHPETENRLRRLDAHIQKMHYSQGTPRPLQIDVSAPVNSPKKP